MTIATAARKPVYRPEVIAESATQYAVNSASDVTTWYTVSVDRGEAYACTCRAGSFGRHCKHVACVQASIDAEAEKAEAARRAPVRIATFQKCEHCHQMYYGLAAEGEWCTCPGAVAAREMPSNVVGPERLAEKRETVTTNGWRFTPG